MGVDEGHYVEIDPADTDEVSFRFVFPSSRHSDYVIFEIHGEDGVVQYILRRDDLKEVLLHAVL